METDMTSVSLLQDSKDDETEILWRLFWECVLIYFAEKRRLSFSGSWSCGEFLEILRILSQTRKKTNAPTVTATRFGESASSGSLHEKMTTTSSHHYRHLLFFSKDGLECQWDSPFLSSRHPFISCWMTHAVSECKLWVLSCILSLSCLLCLHSYCFPGIL